MAGQVVRLKNDWRSIREAATIVSLAFSNDPLIKWIRPGASPWGELDQGSLGFQHRRLQRMNDEFVVYGLLQDQRSAGAQNKVPAVSISKPEGGVGGGKFGAVAMLEPPQTEGLSLHSIYMKLKYWLLDTLSPCIDSGVDAERFAIMMEAHDSGLKRLRRQLHPLKPWYLEVVAVRPSSQGQGLGGKMMRGILELAGDAPIVLECTDRATIKFYQKYGFKEADEMILTDPSKSEDSMSCFWMVKR